MLKKIFLSIIISLTLISPTLAEEANNPTVKITSYKQLYTDQIIGIGSGSGTIISPNGLIISNHHVIFDDNEQKPLDTFEVCITFNVQKEPECDYTAKLIAHDKEMDISLLKINEKDIFGKNIPALNHLNYKTKVIPKEKDEVQVIGYPGSGGDTITITKGQVSGFDTYNNYKYFKTDTDFDHGSSGGTALDKNGNYIGIPTYIRSYAENVGYFLDIRDAQEWIVRAIHESPQQNTEAENRLIFELSRLKKANNQKKFTYTDYPELSIEIPENWKFIEIENESLYAEQEKLTDPVGIAIYFNKFQFKIDEGYLIKLDEELSRLKEYYPDYKKEEIIFNNKNGFKISYSRFNQKQHSIYIPYGYTLIALNYSINLDEEEKQEKAIEEVLKSININSEAIDNPNLNQEIIFKEPSFSITMPTNWRMQKNNSNQPMDLLAEAVKKDDFEGYIYIYYRLIAKDEQKLSTKDLTDKAIKELGGNSRLIYKKDDAVISGLPGWLYIYEYEGSEYQKMRKRLTASIINDDHEFVIYMDDLSPEFDKNLPEFKNILESFLFDKDTSEIEKKYDIGSLGSQFSDIQYHRFESAISKLAEKEIVKGYENGTFRPEQKVTRAEALKIILESKNHLEQERGLGNKINFSKFAIKKGNLKDSGIKDWFNKYVQYALSEKIISGYSNQTFRPQETVNLSEALKIIIGVYEIPIWQGQTDPWHKVYTDKGYDLGLIPRGMDSPELQLTRAELSYIVNRVYNQAK